MRVYISGPMTGYVDHNFPAFNEAAELIRSMGHDVENPADKGLVEGWTWVDYLRYDLVKMMECDAIHLLPYWFLSEGSQLEVHVAKKLGFLGIDARGYIHPLNHLPANLVELA